MNNNTIANYIEEFLAYKTDVENKSIKTRSAYAHDLLTKFLPFLDEKGKTTLDAITEDDIEDFLVVIKKRSISESVANMNRKLATIKSFFAFLQKKKIVENNVTLNISSPKTHAKTICYLTDDEKEKLLTAVAKGTPFYRTRDLTILNLFLGTGLRVSELINLKLQDLEFTSKETNYIRIKRKGGSEARLPIASKLTLVIKEHISKAKITEANSFLFLSRGSKQMHANSIYHLVKHYLMAAEIDKAKYGPHILRHTVGVSLRRKGVDLATIQHLLGHKKLETTAIYLNVEAQDLERAVQLL